MNCKEFDVAFTYMQGRSNRLSGALNSRHDKAVTEELKLTECSTRSSQGEQLRLETRTSSSKCSRLSTSGSRIHSKPLLAAGKAASRDILSAIAEGDYDENEKCENCMCENCMCLWKHLGEVSWVSRMQKTILIITNVNVQVVWSLT